MAMSFNDLLERLKMLDNEHILAFLGEMEIATYIHNPWFLGAMGLLAVCCLIFKWRLLLSTVVGVTGLAWLISYTTGELAESGAKLSSESMLFFVGGGALIIAVMIYILFIKGD